MEQAVEEARLPEDAGYESVWLSQLPTERDTALVLAAYAVATRRVASRPSGASAWSAPPQRCASTSPSSAASWWTARSSSMALISAPAPACTPPRRPDLPILIAALGPRMLELAGELADGVALWMCSPRYIS